jgi:Skp family chaperone for outer membrane proteins
MAAGRRTMRAFALSLALLGAGPLAAQDAGLAILTLDQERLFLESDFGRAVAGRDEVAARALEAENKRIEAELVTEEQALTELRKTLPAEEFTRRATAFDQKVERIRTEQDQKARELTRSREAEQQEFLRLVVPVLGELMTDKGAVAIIDKAALILSLSSIDVTDEAIARVNAAQAAGTEPTPAP